METRARRYESEDSVLGWQQLTTGSFDQHFGLPAPFIIGSLLDVAHRDRPLADAVVVDDDRIAYRDLKLAVDEIAAALVAVGIRPGTHVGIALPTSVSWAAIYLALATIGAVSVPLDPSWRDETAYCVVHADLAALIVDPNDKSRNWHEVMCSESEHTNELTAAGRAESAKRVVLSVHEGALSMAGLVIIPTDENRALCRRLRLAVSDHDLVSLQYTSGTTAHPKAVMLTHFSVLHSAAAVAHRIGIRPGDRYFTTSPLFHLAGSALSLLVALVSGSTLITMKRFLPRSAVDLMHREGCTMIAGLETAFQMLLQVWPHQTNRPSLRGGWMTGGPSLMRDVHAQMSIKEIVCSYGLSEASPNIATAPWQEPEEIRLNAWMSPIDGIQVRVVDVSTGNVLGPGQEGEIQTRGWNVMVGYYRSPDQTAMAIDSDGWLHTGDLGLLDEDGRIRISGRLKDLIRVGGENVSPAEIEDVIASHPAVAIVQVVGIPDVVLGEVPIAYVVRRDGVNVTESDLRRWCRSKCAPFRVPRAVIFLECFEQYGMTGTGKVQKRNLRSLAVRTIGAHLA